MKIAMVSEHASPLAALGGVDAGGQNVHVAELSAALARRGHEVDVYTRRDDAALPERVTTPQGYTVVHVPAGPPEVLPKDDLLTHMGPFARHLDERWRDDRPDVAHAHFWMSGIATQLAARHLDLPAVQTFHALGVVKRRHQGADDTSPQERLRLEAMVARQASWVAATCTDEVFELMRLGRSRNRTSVVPCGVDLDLFTPDGPRAERTDRHRIVSVGRFVPRKGFDVVLRALPAIPDAELVLVGGPDRADVESDPQARRLRALAEQLGVADRLVLHGAVARADMPALLRSADVVACTPWYEPFGIVPLEAMACGVPVVAAAVGGMLDTVVHDVTGRLVTPRRHTEVADAINHLLHDEFLRQSLGAAGRDRAKARYSWDRVAADTERIYDRLAAEQYERPTVSTAAATTASSR
ncbi:glycosyltransferase [Mycobacterium sp. WMMD1722]|uniref:glycosyltransferase n=1 Tax=Mycobacterium sp. WMMD1722 TaxID=3404117 RepID=UPI003BF498A0